MIFTHQHQWSRPFTIGGETYQSGTRCGWRRAFDLKTWKAAEDERHQSKLLLDGKLGALQPTAPKRSRQ